MNSFKFHLFVFSLIFAVGIIFIGCGVTEKKVKESEDRINTLGNQGVHDTMLTESKVLLAQIKACKMSGNSRDCKKYNDSMLVLLDKAEAWYTSKMTEFKPFVDSMHKALTEKKSGLSGLHLKFSDSIFADIDAFISKNWLLQAKQQFIKFGDIFPGLLEDEKTAKKIRPKVVGRWTSVETPISKALNATWRRNFTFKKDGTIKTHESKKGKSQVDLIEDWEFISSGKWDLFGDTILIYIDKEKCTRQTYTTLQVVDGKEKWVKKDQPTYDTTFTEKTKNSYMTYDYITHYMDKRK